MSAKEILQIVKEIICSKGISIRCQIHNCRSYNDVNNAICEKDRSVNYFLLVHRIIGIGR